MIIIFHFNMPANIMQLHSAFFKTLLDILLFKTPYYFLSSFLSFSVEIALSAFQYLFCVSVFNLLLYFECFKYLSLTLFC